MNPEDLLKDSPPQNPEDKEKARKWYGIAGRTLIDSGFTELGNMFLHVSKGGKLLYSIRGFKPENYFVNYDPLNGSQRNFPNFLIEEGPENFRIKPNE